MTCKEASRASGLLCAEASGIALTKDGHGATELGFRRDSAADMLTRGRQLLGADKGVSTEQERGGDVGDEVGGEASERLDGSARRASQAAKRIQKARIANDAVLPGLPDAQAGAGLGRTPGATRMAGTRSNTDAAGSIARAGTRVGVGTGGSGSAAGTAASATKDTVAAASGAASAGAGTVVTHVASRVKKRFEEATGPVAQTQQAQVKGEVVRAAANTTTEVTATKAVLANVGSALAGLATVRATSLPALAGAGPALIAVMLVVTMVLGLTTTASALANSRKEIDLSALEGNARAIAEYLRDRDVDTLHIAAILGNIYQESGYDPTSLEGGSGDVWGAYRGHGICQWTAERWDGAYAGWSTGLRQYSESAGTDWTDLSVQLDYFWAEVTAPTAAGGTGAGPAASYARGQMTASGHTWQDFLAITELEEATEFFLRAFEWHNWTSGRETAQITSRYTEAQRVLGLIATATYITGGNAAQQEIAAEAIRHPRFDARHTESGWCLGWVSHVYETCGFYPTRHETAWQAALATSRDMQTTNIPVGAAVFGSQSAADGAGHIGIYVGAGMVADQMGPRPMSLDAFIAGVGWGGWGWLDGHDFSKVG
jgi:hypothetical protein